MPSATVKTARAMSRPLTTSGIAAPLIGRICAGPAPEGRGAPAGASSRAHSGGSTPGSCGRPDGQAGDACGQARVESEVQASHDAVQAQVHAVFRAHARDARASASLSAT